MSMGLRHHSYLAALVGLCLQLMMKTFWASGIEAADTLLGLGRSKIAQSFLKLRKTARQRHDRAKSSYFSAL